MSRQMTGSTHATEQLLDWVKLVDPTATPILAEEIARHAAAKVNVQTEALIDELAKLNDVCATIVEVARRRMAQNRTYAGGAQFTNIFLKARARMQAQLEVIAAHAEAFGISLPNLRSRCRSSSSWGTISSAGGSGTRWSRG